MPENIHKIYISLEQGYLRAERSFLRECRGFDAVAATEGEVLETVEIVGHCLHRGTCQDRGVTDIEFLQVSAPAAQIANI